MEGNGENKMAADLMDLAAIASYNSLIAIFMKLKVKCA